MPRGNVIKRDTILRKKIENLLAAEERRDSAARIHRGEISGQTLTASPSRRRGGRRSPGRFRNREYQVATLPLGEFAGTGAPAAAEEHDERRGDARQQRRAREQRPDDT